MGLILITFGICKFDIYFNGKANNKKISGKSIFLFLFFLIFSCVMSIRSINVGIDTISYTRLYNIIAIQDSLYSAILKSPISSPIYIIMCWILSKISINPYIMIVFSALFINFFLMLYIKKTSLNYPLSIFCWIGLALFYFSMNGCRQTMAITMVLYSTYIIYNSNFKSIKGWIMFAIAVFIHYTALIFLIGIGLSMLKNKIKNKMSSVFVTTIIITIGVFCLEIIKNITKLIPKYEQYISGENGFSIFELRGNGRIVIVYLFLLVITLLGIYLNKKNEEEKSEIDVFHLKLLPSLIFGLFFGIVNYKNELISRLLLYYMAFYVSFIPYVSNKLSRNFKLFFNIVIVFALSLYSILTLVENKNGVVPYTTFFTYR